MKGRVCEQLTLFPVDSRASRSPSPGSAEAKTMTVTSGQKCSASYRNCGQLGSLVRMCLESSIWHSTRCLLTWKTKATPAKRSLFQLAVLMPRTDDTECAFWPTPKASATMGGCSGARKTLQRMADRGLITEDERRSFSAGNGGKTNPAIIEWLMGYEQQFTKLIPTPRATDFKSAATDRPWMPNSQIVQVERERERRIPAQPLRTCGSHPAREDWPDEPELGRVADGVPNRVDRIKCLGNAVVPQQFYIFFKLIADIENGAT